MSITVKFTKFNLIRFILVVTIALLLPNFHSYAEKDQKTDTSDTSSKTQVSDDSGDKNTSQDSEFKLPEGVSWQTNDSDPEHLNINAPKGGIYKSALRNYPVTFRQVGPDSNSSFRGHMDGNDMALLGFNRLTFNFYPALATHWAIAKDNQTVYFKLNPLAKWSDGKPITADDYLFTIEFMRSEHILAPWYNNYYTEEIVEVKKYDDYTISVKSGKKHIDFLLLMRTTISPRPKHFYKLDKNWVKNYNWKAPPVSGSHVLSSFSTGKFVKFKRNKDWWAKDLKYFRGSKNFDELHLKVVNEEEARWQLFLKGEIFGFGLELDKYWIEKSKNEPSFTKGYVKKVKYYTQDTYGTDGVYLNSEDPLWQDKNVRLAFAHALNFPVLMSELLKGQYKRVSAYYQGYGDYDNPSISPREFSVDKVNSLMIASGWKISEKTGYWNKDGKDIEVQVTPYFVDRTDWWNVLVEKAKDVGFKIIAVKKDQNTLYKEAMQKKFQAIHVGYSVSSSVSPPSYWQFFHSENAKPQSNNLIMLKNEKMDKLIDTYRDSFDVERKKQLSKQILQMIHDDGYYIPWIYKPYDRLGYYRFLKLPKTRGTKFGSFSVYGAGWFDQEEHKKYQQYKKEKKAFSDETLYVDETYK